MGLAISAGSGANYHNPAATIYLYRGTIISAGDNNNCGYVLSLNLMQLNAQFLFRGYVEEYIFPFRPYFWNGQKDRRSNERQYSVIWPVM